MTIWELHAEDYAQLPCGCVIQILVGHYCIRVACPADRLMRSLGDNALVRAGWQCRKLEEFEVLLLEAFR